MNASILVGDVLDRLRELPDASVQCVVTSPPFWGLRDYGCAGQLGLEQTPDAYVAKLVEVFREVRRVMRDDATLWLNLGDSYAGGGPHHGNNNTGKSESNRGSITGTDRPVVPGIKPKDLVGIPWRVAFALQADGWYLRSDIIWAKPNPMPESVTDRPTKSHEYIFLLTKRARYFFDQEAVREGGSGRSSGLRTYKYDNLEGHETKRGFLACADKEWSARNVRSVWTIATQPFAGAHFATFPEELVERCIKAGSRQDDTILDPFAGSGTTGVVALALGRSFVGIELSATYAAMSEKRIASVAPLFAAVETDGLQRTPLASDNSDTTFSGLLFRETENTGGG